MSVWSGFHPGRYWVCSIGAHAARRRGTQPMTHADDKPSEPDPRETLGTTDLPEPVLHELLYDRLRELAGIYMQRERADHTLQPTALVNEAYLKLIRTPDREGGDRARFLGVAARAMRQVLVDHARGRHTDKRGGGWTRVTLTGIGTRSGTDEAIDTLALDAALKKLESSDERAARVVELRFFGGMTIPEAASLLGVSHTTVESDWAFARAWIRREIGGDADG